jgi:hypothetical protein
MQSSVVNFCYLHFKLGVRALIFDFFCKISANYLKKEGASCGGGLMQDAFVFDGVIFFDWVAACLKPSSTRFSLPPSISSASAI